MKEGRSTPLMMEFAINPATGPFLVTSSQALMWVSPRTSRVRSAFRSVNVGPFFQEIVDMVYQTGAEASWGNACPLTPAGIVDAIAHVRSYGLEDLEILAHVTCDFGGVTVASRDVEGEMVEFVAGLPIERVDWLDPMTVVVLPQDREFVGFLMLAGSRGVAVIHNASRAMGVCRGRG